MKTRVMIGLIVALVIATAAVGQDRTPSQVYGPLFEDVQMQRVFPDGKTFVDAVPRDAPAIVMQRYQVSVVHPTSISRPSFSETSACSALRRARIVPLRARTYAHTSITCGTC